MTTAMADDVVRELRERHQTICRDTTFKLYGLEWDLAPGVYAPSLTQGAALYADWIPLPVGGAFCDIGTGTGYLSVLAAKAGCARVLATDVSGAAVENARRNVQRHGVTQQVEVRESDLFESIGPNEKFDVIFWNSSFLDGHTDDGQSPLDVALSDPGYRVHERFLREAPRYLTRRGQVFLGFSDLGNLERLSHMAQRMGRTLRVARAAHVETQFRSMVYQLLELEALT